MTLSLEVARNELLTRIAGDVVLSRSVGRSMRKWRELFSISQQDLAIQLQVFPSVVSDYEKGRRTSPGVGFVKKYIDTLVDLDVKRGSPFLKTFLRRLSLPVEAVLDIKEFSLPISVERIVSAIRGLVLARPEALKGEVYGYTIIDSLKCIELMSGAEFAQLMGLTTKRALIFTNASTGRATMVAVRVATMKPAVVILHGPEQVDPLAVRLAEKEQIPLILSKLNRVETIIDSLRRIAA